MKMAITDLIATIFISLLVFVLVISYFIIKFKVVDYETEIQKNQKEIRDLNEKISKLKARKPRKKEIKKSV
jgi:cell division protein FtsL